jgi:hypothetical protein
MNRSKLIRKMLTPMWVLHIGIDTALIVAYFVYVHPPSAASTVSQMALEICAVLGGADIVTHFALAYD